uniref:ribonuclease H n=1 Tax=Paramormyrops kingsleyae TaxID=1676925 RepID=A0A3B3QH18_9TELE
IIMKFAAICDAVANQSVLIDQLQREVADLRQSAQSQAASRGEVEALRQEVASLREAVRELAGERHTPRAAVRLSSPALESHISLPDKWNGVDGTCDVFLTALDLLFEFQPARYSTDRQHIALLVSLLTGQAAEWTTAIIHSGSDIGHSYPEFTHQLRATFCHPDSEVETDSRLYHLRQGGSSVSRYTADFRTLTVQTTWGDSALRTPYYEGLAPRIRDELAGRELPATLEGLIQLALRIDQRMSSRPRPTPPSSPTSAGAVSPPRPVDHSGAGEPMQLGRASLTTAERDRRYREGLCAYCASPKHYRAICPLPHRVPYPFSPLMRPFQVHLQFGHKRVKTSAFIDSGAAGNFIDQTYAKQLGVELEALPQPVPITAVDGRPLTTSPITHQTQFISLSIGHHQERIQFLVTSILSPPIILGHPWLLQHDPLIAWTQQRILQWGSTCSELCLQATAGACSREPEAPDVDPEAIPQPYRDLAEVFCRKQAVKLPPHRPYDLAIDLLPGAVPPRGRLFSLSPTETKAMEEYVADALRQGTIRPSSSPTAAGFFFVKKKDGGLRPCVDYRGLNNITVKNHHPLPLTNTALDALSGATHFTKLDLRSTYNLVRIRESDEWKTLPVTLRVHPVFYISQLKPFVTSPMVPPSPAPPSAPYH